MLPALAVTLVRRRRLVAAGTAVVLAVAVPVVVSITAVAGMPSFPGVAVPSADALAEIPSDALGAYQEAGAAYQLDWALLAGIGKLECDHGRSQLPGCTPNTINGFGARGYMQFLGSTWRASLEQFQLEPRDSPPAADGDGYATDGDGDGSADPWSWPDAAFSAARYLAANGAASDPAAALFAYNHDHQYVTDVLATATRYRGSEELAPATYQGNAGAVPLVTVDGITVHAQLGGRLAALLAAARRDGITLSGSGYRTADAQLALRRAHCGTTAYAIYEMPANQCSPPTALPGESLHERGLAIDFTCDGVLVTADDRCFRWLSVNAEGFGLFGLKRESWHWSVDGT